ncbi:hypothetical protein K491DRAFT_676707 [Lophiostoma macrostomum CBS 122681]|uniref:Uncharacterized protein n=1 Tax=Lophiostoma macrostomum CBS 122681 TaxID=1314788 RepID=A0A6A6TF93_9PLEO|nr:hypothetical protein K491DRAFT_676707 [Lophiostoma macrostomum CBS 122681]
MESASVALAASMNPATSSYSVRDKIFHTDLRITSIEEVIAKDEVPQSSQPLEASQVLEDAAQQERAAEMQIWWDEAIAKNMNLPDGYSKVAVLIIKWQDELDDLKTRQEAEELDAIFRNTFHYACQTVELNVKSKPQHQMNSHISAFVNRYDGPNNLMIVYYTGHGVFREDTKTLEIRGSTDLIQERGIQNEARANWNKAEDALISDDIEGDVLTILDTCYSSNIAKAGNEDTRTFELLSACSYDTTTAKPGPLSFTRALIDAMKELVKEHNGGSFTTFHLNQRILINPNRRDTPSQLWHRLKHHERHIRLAPLKPRKDREHKPSFTHPARGYLTLRFAVRDESLNREQIEYLTKNLSQAFNNKALIGLKRIDWIGLKPARSTHFGRAALAIIVITQWRRFVNRKKEERRKSQKVDAVKLPTQYSDPCDENGSFPT